MSIFKDGLIRQGAAGVSTGYTIDQSIRFNDDDSAYLQRTPSSDGNRKTWTWSGWVKKGENDDYGTLFEAYKSGSQNFKIRFDNSSGVENTIRVHQENTTTRTLLTNRKFRDNSAWYHIVFVFDTTETVSTERMRLFINGERETSFSTESYPSLDELSMINSTEATQNMGWSDESNGLYFDGYMAEIHLLDGYAYGPEYFGEFESNGIWIPKEYTGSYGTNGFYIKGQDSSDLGNDSSGNNNDYTVSGLATHDFSLDSPTNNFCSGLPTGVGNATGVAFSNGNLTGKTSGTAGNWVSSIPVDSGKWYFEVNNHANGSGNNIGIGQTPDGSYHYFALGSGGNQINDYDIPVVSPSSGTIIGFKLDFDAGTLTHTTDGSSYSSTGSLTSGMSYAAFARLGASSGHVAFNFGQDSTFGGLETAGGNSDGNDIGDFYYNVPSGFLAICTNNLGS